MAAGLAEAGDLDKPFATEAAMAELTAMSTATVDRYLKPARDTMRIKGISTTKPSPLLRNSITTRTCSDEKPERPGVIEADTVAQIHLEALLRTEWFSVQPVTRSVIVSVRANSPIRLGPQSRRHRGTAGAVPVRSGDFRFRLRG
ncbi:hypothetical protein MFM001_46880 [Mycobacterium sp. MFM001]|nr:hypothetical protein MFM001_46880 [Mycobacterium sp. MFM001]